jgi:tetratricopeptide (TPR) repeat protein/tRNA A-37 threonylcarbamoyl transferase component Bud32
VSGNNRDVARPTTGHHLRIDRICDRFEAAWAQGADPRIEDYLGHAGSPDRDATLRELLALEVELRRRGGAEPVPSDYAGRFPGHEATVEAAFGGARGPDLTTRDRDRETSPRETCLDPDTAAARAPMPSAPQGYEILGPIGRGGMGVVYKAIQLRLNRIVALKMVLAGEYSTPEALLRFMAEAEAVARLQHPNVVQVFDRGEYGGLPYLSMEYLAAGSLARRIDGTPWPARRAAEVVGQIARGVAEVHRRGIVHRDLKPANVLMADDGTPKVGDFGLAKSLGSESSLTRTDLIIGSPSYMAPEQAQGKAKTAGPPADVYALGAILYELLTGRPPFRGTSTQETLALVCSSEPVAPSRLVPKVPRDVETITLKCLQKDPRRRYESAGELRDDLGRWLRGEPIRARSVGELERAWRWCRRKPWLAGLSAALLLMMAATTVGSWLAAAKLGALARDEAAAAQKARMAEVVADAERGRAELEADKAREVARFLAGLFDASDPLGLGKGVPLFSGNPGGANKPARQLLDDGVARLETELRDRPQIRAELLHTIGTVYLGLCEFDLAESTLRKALKLRREALKPDDPAVADTLQSLGLVLYCLVDRGATALFREAMVIRRSHFGDDDRTVESMFLYGLALSLDDTQPEAKHVEGERLLEDAVAIRSLRHGDRSVEVGLSRLVIAFQQSVKGDHFRAASNFGLAASILQERGKNDLVLMFQAMVAAEAAAALKRPAAAIPLYRQAFEMAESLLGADHAFTGLARFRLGERIAEVGRLDEAEPILRRAHQSYIRNNGADHVHTASVLLTLGMCLRDMGRADDALTAMEDAVRIMRVGKRGIRSRLLSALDACALLRDDRGDHEGAISLFREGVEAALKPPFDDPSYAASLLSKLRVPYQRTGDFDAWKAIAREALPRIEGHPAYSSKIDRRMSELTKAAEP